MSLTVTNIIQRNVHIQERIFDILWRFACDIWRHVNAFWLIDLYTFTYRTPLASPQSTRATTPWQRNARFSRPVSLASPGTCAMPNCPRPIPIPIPIPSISSPRSRRRRSSTRPRRERGRGLNGSRDRLETETSRPRPHPCANHFAQPHLPGPITSVSPAPGL